jgi:hypothetical protein
MSNININGLTAVHKKSKGKLMTTDVCMTPPFCVPIPYSNLAESAMTDMGATSVKIQGSPACNAKSNFKMSTGDAPGVCSGVMSASIGQMAEFITFSNDVKIEGKPAVRNTDKMVSNMKNTGPMPLMQPPAGMAMAGKAKAAKALEKEEFSLRWQALDPVTGEPIEGMPYSIILDGKVVVSGKTGTDGRTERRLNKQRPENLKIFLGEGSWAIHTPDTAFPAEREIEIEDEVEENE